MQDWVVFVPGFAASHLFRYDAGGDRGVKLWLSQLDIAWSGIEHLDLADDVAPANLDLIRPGSPIYEVYQPFLAFLALHGIPVAYFGYDWRADVATNGQRLADFLNDERTSNTRMHIVTHSMGGLIAASALNRIADATIPRVAQFIACGTPWHGSYRSLELLAGVHETVQKIVSLNTVFSRRNKFAWTKESIRVVASWHGVYDLLPMPEMMAAYPPGPGQDFMADNWLGAVNVYFSRPQYTAAVARRPIHVGFPPSVQFSNFRGMGRHTSGPSPTVFDGFPDHWPKALRGDGAVPEFSSKAPAILNATELQFDADHEQFLNEHDVQQALGRHIGFLS